MSDGPGRWVPKDAFVMTVLPPDLEIDPMLASLLHVAAFLELSADEAVNPDFAVEALEHVSHYLQTLPDAEVERLRSQLNRIADHSEREGWPEEFTDFARHFLSSLGVENEDE